MKQRDSDTPKTVLALVAICIAGLVLRLSRFSDIFPGDRMVIFPGNDSYFHMRRIFATLTDWPAVPMFDKAMNHPDGAAIIWPPLFDFVIATICAIAGFGPDDIFNVETFSAFLIPLLGVATILPLYLIVKHTFDEPTAIIAAFLLALTPAHIWYSRLGFVDHHVAETFIVTVGMLSLLMTTKTPNRGWAIVTTFLFAAGLLTWNGFLLYVALFDIFLLWLLITEQNRSRVAMAGAVIHIGTALLISPFVVATVAVTTKPFSPLTLSWLHVTLIGLFGLFAFSCHPRWSAARKKPWAVPAGVGLGAIALLVTLREKIAEGMGWLGTTDSFMAEVSESFSIFTGPDGFFLLTAPFAAMTPFFLLVPLVIIFLALELRAGTIDRKGGTLVLVMSIALLLLTIKQRRFAQSFAPMQATVIAFGLMTIYRRTKKVWSPQGVAILLGVVVLGLVSPWAVLPTGTGYEKRMSQSLKTFRQSLPPGSNDAIMTPWSLGHVVLYRTGLPVVANNFGAHIGQNSFDDANTFYLTEDESEAAAILERRKVKYVLVDEDLDLLGSFSPADGDVARYVTRSMNLDGESKLIFHPPLLKTIYFRLGRLAGSEKMYNNKSGGTLMVPALEQFRLVYDSGVDGLHGYPKIYEFVRGARLSIEANQGETITLTHRFVTSAGREKTYRSTLVADTVGRAKATVPYSGNWLVTGSEQTVGISVPEEAVITGGAVKIQL